MTVRHGRNTQLLLQRESAFGQEPAAAAFEMKFSEFDEAPAEEREGDPTANAQGLAEKSLEVDEGGTLTIKSVFCLNDIGQWLSLLWGTPNTTGAGPYTHTFTLGLADRPSGLLELGYLAASRFNRWLGCGLNTIGWNVKEGEQAINLGLMAAFEKDPVPTSAFDASPTAYALNQACKKAGQVEDVDGASTLGQVINSSVQISNDLEGQLLADGNPGYGAYLLGQPAISGTVRALFADSDNVEGYRKGHTSRALILTSTNKAGDHSLTLNLPQVEFNRMRHSVRTARGLVQEWDWQAHNNGTEPTLVLVNSVATY